MGDFNPIQLDDPCFGQLIFFIPCTYEKNLLKNWGSC